VGVSRGDIDAGHDDMVPPILILVLSQEHQVDLIVVVSGGYYWMVYLLWPIIELVEFLLVKPFLYLLVRKSLILHLQW
jgi:hypothetical protein